MIDAVSGNFGYFNRCSNKSFTKMSVQCTGTATHNTENGMDSTKKKS